MKIENVRLSWVNIELKKKICSANEQFCFKLKADISSQWNRKQTRKQLWSLFFSQFSFVVSGEIAEYNLNIEYETLSFFFWLVLSLFIVSHPSFPVVHESNANGPIEEKKERKNSEEKKTHLRRMVFVISRQQNAHFFLSLFFELTFTRSVTHDHTHARSIARTYARPCTYAQEPSDAFR